MTGDVGEILVDGHLSACQLLSEGRVSVVGFQEDFSPVSVLCAVAGVRIFRFRRMTVLWGAVVLENRCPGGKIIVSQFRYAANRGWQCIEDEIGGSETVPERKNPDAERNDAGKSLYRKHEG